MDHKFIIDGKTIFRIRIHLQEDPTKIMTKVFYNHNDPENPDDNIPNQLIKAWDSLGNHEPNENPKDTYLNVEVVFFIPEFKSYDEPFSDMNTEFSTLYARVRIMSTFKKYLTARSEERTGAIFYTGKIKILEPVMKSSKFGF
jgi:hypothetical protein